MLIPRKEIELILPGLSYKIVGCCFKVHDVLGRYALESQYSNLLAKIFEENKLIFEKEKNLSKTGDDVNRADFIVDNSIVLELKAKPFISKDDYYQVRRYLELANLKLGLIVNFRQKHLNPKRILNSQCSNKLE